MILDSRTITTALTAAVTDSVEPRAIYDCNLDHPIRGLTVEFIFTYGADGTTCKAWLQTSLDGGTTWIDIANGAFTTSTASKVYNLSAATPVTTAATPTDGSLADNTCVDGILGDLFRVKTTTTGTYKTSTTLKVVACFR